MAQLLEPGAQKLIASKRVVKQEGTVYEYEITVNGAVQKEVYEKLFAARAKDVEVKGFRKGEAPRNTVEPQIYGDVSKDMVNLLINYTVEELLADEKIIAITTPEVVSANFTMVESPLTFVVKIDKLPEYKLPDLKKFTVKMPKIEISDEDVKTAKENLWTEWNKKAKEEDKKEFTELNDAWVEKQMKIPNVKTVTELDGLLREELEHAKLHQEEDKLVSDTLDKVIADTKIEVPAAAVEKSVEANRKAQEEQMKQYGITFDQYLKHYNKTEEEYKKEVAEASEKRFREDVYWTLFIRDRGLKINPQDAKDVVYINYAASAMRIKPDEKLSQRQVDVLLQTAAMYKAVQVFRNEIGLVAHEEPDIAVGENNA